MVNWKDISLDFTEELVQNWQEKGFDFEEVKKWIEVGFKPSDHNFIIFIKNELEYSLITVREGNMDIEALRLMYQTNLEEQSLIFSANLNEQEAIRRSILSQEDEEIQKALFFSQSGTKKITTENLDMGWLTDDNITYILENDELIKVANIQVKKDIANIYLQIEKTKRGENVDNDFWSSLDTKKKYIILPLRVSGNHWSMLLFVNNEYTGEVNWVYYISSLEQSIVNEEIKEISNFLKQIGKRFGSVNNSIINENNLSEMVFKENPKQPNTWDCGVYVCMFTKFLCIDEYYNLNGQNLIISDQQIKEFRDKWKRIIGEEQWCKWDDNANKKTLIEPDELRNALTTLSFGENNNQQPLPGNSVGDEKDKIIAELYKKNAQLEEELDKVQNEKVKNLTSELIEIKNGIEVKLNDNQKFLLETVLTSQEQITRLEKEKASLTVISLSRKQLLNNTQKLIELGISAEGLGFLCQLKEELTNLEIEREEKTETRIEVISRN